MNNNYPRPSSFSWSDAGSGSSNTGALEKRKNDKGVPNLYQTGVAVSHSHKGRKSIKPASNLDAYLHYGAMLRRRSKPRMLITISFCKCGVVL